MTDNSPMYAAVFLLVVLVPKTVQLVRDPGSPALRATCGVLGSLCAAELVSWYPIYHAAGQASGIPNLGRYLMHLLALTAAAAVQSLFLHLSDPATARRRARWRWLLLAVVAVVMGVAFHLAKFPVEDAEHFTDRYANAPYMREYLLGFLAYLALAMADIVRMSVRYSRQLPPSALRAGLRVLAAGAVVGLLYVVHKTAFLLFALPWSERPATRVLIVLGIVLVSSGFVLASAARTLTLVARWPLLYRLHRDMRPLWQALHPLDTSVSLDPAPRRTALTTIDITVYRRMVEILDILRTHRAYLDPVAGAAAAHSATEAGLPPDRVRAIGDAATIAAMVEHVTTTVPGERVPVTGEGGHALTLDEEDRIEVARRLAAISRAYATDLKGHHHAVASRTLRPAR